MEPMTLGSPVSAPGSPQIFPSSPHNPGPVHPAGFLPGFLMGDYSQQSPSMVSPNKMNRHGHVVSSPSQPPLLMKPHSGFLTPTATASGIRTPSEKPGGPPVTGLFSTPKRLHPRLGGTPLGGTPQGHCTPLGGPVTPMPSTPQLSFGGTPSGNETPLKLDNTHRDAESTLWVTVFGFPPSASSYMLSQFSQCGTILQHYSTNNGNWIHIKYQTRMQAQKALGRSGRVFGGTLMVGVVPCSDPGNLDSSHMESSVFGGVTTVPVHHESVMADSFVIPNGNSTLNTTKSIRPLTQSYRLAQKDLDVSSTQVTPNKTNGIVSKAMEFIFGW